MPARLRFLMDCMRCRASQCVPILYPSTETAAVTAGGAVGAVFVPAAAVPAAFAAPVAPAAGTAAVPAVPVVPAAPPQFAPIPEPAAEFAYFNPIFC